MSQAQVRVLERIATGAPLADVLSELVHLIESQLGGVHCACVLTDQTSGTTRLVAAPSLSEQQRATFQSAGPGTLVELGWVRLPVSSRDGTEVGALVVRGFGDAEMSDADRRLLEGATHIFGIAIERESAEHQLRDTNELLRALIDTAPIGIIAIHPSGHVILWNAAAEE